MGNERCEPPEALRGIDGWHWLQRLSADPELAWWFPPWTAKGGGPVFEGRWGQIPGRIPLRATDAAAAGYRYVTLAITPEHVAALVRAARGVLLAVDNLDAVPGELPEIDYNRIDVGAVQAALAPFKDIVP